MFPDLIPRVTPGERPSADKWNRLADAAGQNNDLPQSYSDGTGISQAQSRSGIDLVRFCLADNHPGRGVVFDIYIAVWNAATHAWGFPDCEEADKKKCIDWDMGVPEPDAGSRGFGIWKPSTTYGQILHVVTMDCETPGVCCS